MTDESRTERARVVVGIDDSPGARAAAGFAVAEARLRGARLVAVTALSRADAALFNPYSTRRHPKADVLGHAEKMVRSTLAALDCDGLDVRVVVTTEAPGRALIDHSAFADLLVVGSRGHAGLAGLVLGATNLQCVLHARCPVTVVRPEPARAVARTADSRGVAAG